MEIGQISLQKTGEGVIGGRCEITLSSGENLMRTIHQMNERLWVLPRYSYRYHTYRIKTGQTTIQQAQKDNEMTNPQNPPVPDQLECRFACVPLQVGHGPAGGAGDPQKENSKSSTPDSFVLAFPPKA